MMCLSPMESTRRAYKSPDSLYTAHIPLAADGALDLIINSSSSLYVCCACLSHRVYYEARKNIYIKKKSFVCFIVAFGSVT